MRELELITLAEAIPDENIFSNMVSAGLSFIPSAVIADYLDSDYFANCSGGKQASPLVVKWSGQPDYVQKLASLIVNRYRAKWEQLFARYSDMSTLNLLHNINVEKETEYGKKTEKYGSDSLNKSGTETHTLGGSETREETFPVDRKTTRTVQGGWKDTDTTSTTRTGVQDVTESFSAQTPRRTSKQTMGGYTDTDTTANTRTGTQIVTDKGNTLTGTFGFNSSIAVNTAISGPETSAGISQETTFGETGLKDTKSGSITRSYGENGLTETTTESGSKTLSTTFGQNGLKDENAGNVQRLYENYSDEIKETGSKLLTIGYGQGGKTDELSFNNRSDSRSTSDTITDSGSDTETELGYRYGNLVEQYLTLFMSSEYLDFLAIVYSDCDEILTCPFYV